MLTFLLTFPFPVFSLKGGLSPPFSSTLLFLKIRIMTDCFFLSSFIYLSTPVSFTLVSFKFQHAFSLVLLFAFRFSCDYARSPGPPSPPFQAASPRLASSFPAPAEDFAAWLSSPCCCCCSARDARAFPLLPAQWRSDWAPMWFASFYFGVSPFEK